MRGFTSINKSLVDIHKQGTRVLIHGHMRRFLHTHGKTNHIGLSQNRAHVLKLLKLDQPKERFLTMFQAFKLGDVLPTKVSGTISICQWNWYDGKKQFFLPFLAVCQNPGTPVVHIKIAGLKWMFIPLKMVLIVDFPIEKGGSFHSYVSLSEGISLLKSYFHRYWSIAIYLLLPSQSWDVFGLTWLQFRLLSTWGWCHATWRH